jgi:hypothetical protein
MAGHQEGIRSLVLAFSLLALGFGGLVFARKFLVYARWRRGTGKILRLIPVEASGSEESPGRTWKVQIQFVATNGQEVVFENTGSSQPPLGDVANRCQ